MYDDVIEINVDDYEIRWEMLAIHYERYDYVLCTLIVGVIIPNRRGHEFPIGWGIC